MKKINNLLKTLFTACLLMLVANVLNAQPPCGTPTGGVCTNPAADYSNVDWNLEPPVTPVNQTIFLLENNSPAGIPATMFDFQGVTSLTGMTVQDSIGVFFVRNDSLFCAGKQSLFANTGNTFNFPIYGDEPTTPEIDGLILGNQIEFVLYKNAAGVTYYLDFAFYAGPIQDFIINIFDFTDTFNQEPSAGDKSFTKLGIIDCEGNAPDSPDYNTNCCNDPTACNYNPTAPEATNCDFGDTTCPDPCNVVIGCTDPLACNYDAAATCDDGNCVLGAGCTDAMACNYDPAAICDDSSCIVVNGGTISTTDATTNCSGDGIADVVTVTASGEMGANYAYVITDGTGTTILGGPNTTGSFDLEGAPSGTCLIWGIAYDETDAPLDIPTDQVADITGCFALSNSVAVVREQAGCTDPTALNYDPTAECEFGCMFATGCTDATACNYDAGATMDDGSCIIVNGGTISTTDATTNCSGDGVADVVTVTVSGEAGANYAYIITDGSATTILGGPNTTGSFDLEGAPAGTCLIWGVAYDETDGPLNIPTDQVADISGCFALSNSVAVVREQGGCTDPTACNFDAAAQCDDGSCITPDGCTDAAACNFDPTAVCDDSSCDYGDAACPDPCNVVAGCTDPAACNYDATATCDNGSCMPAPCNPGCTDPMACNYDDAADADDGSCILAAGGVIDTTDPTEICAGDGIADPIDVTLTDAAGNSAWVITDANGLILALAAGPPFDLDGAGAGVCLIWHLGYGDDLGGAFVGNNATTDLTGCYSLSNPITVTRTASSTWYEDVDGDGLGDANATFEGCDPPAGYVSGAPGFDSCPTLDNALFDQPCDDGNPATALSFWSAATCNCEPVNDNCSLDLPNGEIIRQGALYGITDFPIDGNEVYTWYDSNNTQVAQFVGYPYYSPGEEGSYYLIVTDPDNPDCFQFFNPRSVTELNGCCELEGLPSGN